MCSDNCEEKENIIENFIKIVKKNMNENIVCAIHLLNQLQSEICLKQKII